MIVTGPLVGKLLTIKLPALYRNPSMPVTAKSTKAEILAAYEAIQANPTTWADAWALTATTARTVAKEARLLALDIYKGGCLARQWVQVVVDTYRQPVLRSKA